MLSKEEIRIITLHEFKLGRKASDATKTYTRNGEMKRFLNGPYVDGLKSFGPEIPASRMKMVVDGHQHLMMLN